MANDTLGLNIVFPIYNADGTSFHDITMKKSAFSGTTMSLNDKVSGEFLFKDSSLTFTQKEYIVYNGVHYCMDNPPTLVKEGIVGDNSELKGMSKYSVEFLHPMCHLADIPFLDVAVSDDEVQYLSDRKKFSWIGKPADFVAKLNKNLQHTEWCVVLSDRFPNEKLNELSEVLSFENSMISDALQKWYETWKLPFIIDVVENTEAVYSQGKRFKIVLGLASNEIYATDSDRQTNNPFVFQMGQGVGLKNNSRTPRNNKIVTRISGYGSEKNIPYGYPQVRWFGTAGQSYTYGDNVGVYENVTIGGHTFAKVISYPIYKGILNGAYVELIQHPFTRSNLMPSVYRQTLFNKISFINEDGTPNTDYDPDIELVDYYDAIYSEEHQYPNPINPLSPSYEAHEFDKIKPELGEANILSVTPLNNDLTVANEWVDDIDENGEFEQSFFKVKLPILAFDLYACASITEEMEINMRSGRCLGCTFPVQIDWDDYKVNFYDSEGNFAPNGAQRNLDKYPKSNLGSIEVILKKENSTFGTVMPNKYQYPIGESEEGANDGDSFVILGISLPESYILNAEERLDADMKSYMLENNVYYFDYPLKFDEFFLRNNTNILRQIKQNTIIRFRFNNQELSLSVKELSIKYGDSVLPQYSITLTDNVEVSVNSIGQVADDVDKLSSMLSILRESYSKNVWVELSNKLSKTQDDTAKGLISFLKGLQIGKNFVGGTFGEGAQFVKDENGKTYLELDRLYVRLKAYFDNVEIRDSQHTKGNRYGTNAGCKCIAVDAFDSNGEITTNANEVAKYRCYFRGTDNDNTITNDFVVGDLAYCHVSNVVSDSELYQHNYWRLVIGKSSDVDANGNHYIDLSNETSNTIDGVEYSGYMANSDKPLAQDDIIQLGNVNDATRRGAVAEYVSGIDTPSYQIFQSLGSIGSATTIAEKQAAQFSFEGKNVINLGYSSTQGRAFMKVYGDAYIGDANKNAYIEFKQVGANNRPELNIKAKIDASSTIGDQTWNEYLENNQNALDELQSQIDGEIDTWFENVDPSPLVSPEKEWIEIDTESGNNNERLKHLGDVYYNNQTGYAWRYTNNGTSETPVFTWVEISDSAVTKALTTVNAIVSNYGNVLNIQSPTAEGVGQALGFLRQVLGGNVTADGGLVLAHMIALKDSNDNIMSGINGTLDTTLVDSLHTPAAWYGGAMVDYEALNNIQKAQGWNTWKWARSLFRFDGSGYLADGNISWNKEGLMTIRDLETIITNNNNTVALNDVSTLTSVFHTHVADNVVYIYPQNNFCNIRVSRTLSGYTINDYDVLNRGEMDARYVRTEFFNKIFRPYKLVNNQQTMVSVNDTSIIDGSALLDNLKILVGTWTDSYLSALGQNPNSGGGGASYNRLDSWASYDASKAGWVLSAGLGNDLNSRVTSLENGQIEGVATQEWVQSQGYLTELSAATTNALGAIKIGYSANGKNYPVLLDNNNRAYVSVPWSDTWRPLGTGANDACAGNDARLSDARPASDVYDWAKASTKPTYTLDDVADGSSRKLSNYLPLSGGTMTGAIKWNSSIGLEENSWNNTGTYKGLEILNCPGYQNTGAPSKYAVGLKVSAYYSFMLAYNASVERLYYKGGDMIGWDKLANFSDLASYLPLAGGTMSNTNVVTNLNADLLDGKHYSDIILSNGRNLVRGYDVERTSSEYLAWPTHVFTETVEEGAQITITLEYSTSSDSTKTWIQAYTGGGYAVIASFDATPGLNHNIQSKTTTVHYLAGYNNNGICLLYGSSGATGALTVHRIKVERGDHFTGWTPAPEDVITSKNIGSQSVSYASSAGSCSGNAVTATKLQTSRTLWGQSFNGSANVSGAMTGVTSVDGLLYFDTTNGYIGIGTSSSRRELTVAGNIFIHKATSDSQAIIINDPNLTAGCEKIQFCRSEADSAGIHWFHDKFGGYSFLENCVNIVANNGCVTLGAWNAPALLVTPTDNVGIGTTSPNYKLDVAGVIHSSVGMFSDGYVSALGQNTSSDERLKDIKGNINVSIDVLANAPSKLFEWKGNKALGAQVGTIAQYWQKALPQVVHDRGDGYLSMQYDVAALLGTITIAKRVQNHEERIKELERENEALREQLKELKG